jgi:hypothetical protein
MLLSALFFLFYLRLRLLTRAYFLIDLCALKSARKQIKKQSELKKVTTLYRHPV